MKWEISRVQSERSLNCRQRAQEHVPRALLRGLRMADDFGSCAGGVVLLRPWILKQQPWRRDAVGLSMKSIGLASISSQTGASGERTAGRGSAGRHTMRHPGLKRKTVLHSLPHLHQHFHRLKPNLQHWQIRLNLQHGKITRSREMRCTAPRSSNSHLHSLHVQAIIDPRAPSYRVPRHRREVFMQDPM